MIPPISVLMPSFKDDNDLATCSMADFRRLLYLVLQLEPFDERWYLEAYPDVRVQMEAGQIVSAVEHYRSSGYLEGRFPSKPSVDEEWYLREYPDVQAAITRGDVKSAYDHFVSTGAKEGRMPRMIAIDAKWYRETYPSVGQRISRKESVTAQDDFQKYGYRYGLLPTRPTLNVLRR